MLNDYLLCMLHTQHLSFPGGKAFGRVTAIPAEAASGKIKEEKCAAVLFNKDWRRTINAFVPGYIAEYITGYKMTELPRGIIIRKNDRQE